jgi:hypothetical protein
MAILTPEERASFKTCRRAWDYHARGRRSLEPMVAVDTLDADRAMRDALAVYYFPGMWDWTRSVVAPLVSRALEGALDKERARLGPDLAPRFEERAGAVRQLLQAYTDWAPTVERLAPVLVELEYEADVADPDRPESAIITPVGESVRYQGRIDMLAVDAHDAYWIVRHRVVREWTPEDALARDEEAQAACWAWEQFYIGMEIAGTVHNEMRLPTEPGSAGGSAGSPGTEPERGGPAQHEGSGGGRSIPQHRRLYARANEPAAPQRVVRDSGPLFRRTWIRRSRAEIAQAGRQLATEARQMFDPAVAVYPSPSGPACRRCPFAAPCLALYEGRVAEAAAILDSSYRRRPPDEPVEGRLGSVTWSTGRGAAPPRFSGTRVDR